MMLPSFAALRQNAADVAGRGEDVGVNDGKRPFAPQNPAAATAGDGDDDDGVDGVADAIASMLRAAEALAKMHKDVNALRVQVKTEKLDAKRHLVITTAAYEKARRKSLIRDNATDLASARAAAQEAYEKHMAAVAAGKSLRRLAKDIHVKLASIAAAASAAKDAAKELVDLAKRPRGSPSFPS